MKKHTSKIALIALIGASLAATEQPHRHQAVLAWVSLDGVSDQDERGLRYEYLGATVYCSSSSTGAPTFPQRGQDDGHGGFVPLTGAAEAIATLRDQGFQVKIGDNGLFFSATK